MQTKVLITIDTEVRNEGRHLPDAYERYVLGSDDPNNLATYWIAKNLEEYRFPGVFFLDVYGTAEFPKASYPALCERLLKGGHSVQLHTHPDRMYDRQRLNMHEYTLQDQVAIVRKGAELVQEWTGKYPIAHRAGRYGANVDTLTALRENGILLDSSFFYGRENCKLPFPMSNLPFTAHGVLQIPVTVAPIPIAKLGRELPEWTQVFWHRYQKIDVNSMSADRLCRSIKGLLGKVPYLVTFLHSFSFSRRLPSGFVADKPAIEAFEAMLALLKESQAEIITFENIPVETNSQWAAVQ